MVTYYIYMCVFSNLHLAQSVQITNQKNAV